MTLSFLTNDYSFAKTSSLDIKDFHSESFVRIKDQLKSLAKHGNVFSSPTETFHMKNAMKNMKKSK